MKIKYKFSTETVEIEIDDKWSEIMLELDRQEYNANRRETKRQCSLDALDRDSILLPSDTDVEGECIRKDETARLYSALEKLKPRQRHLIRQVYFEGKNYAEIGLEEGRDRSSVRKATETAVKKLKKYLK